MIRSLSCNEHKRVDTPIKLRRCQSGGSHHGQGGRRTVPSSGTWSLRLPFCCRKSIQIPWWDRWIFHTVVASLFFPCHRHTQSLHPLPVPSSLLPLFRWSYILLFYWVKSLDSQESLKCCTLHAAWVPCQSISVR